MSTRWSSGKEKNCISNKCREKKKKREREQGRQSVWNRGEALGEEKGFIVINGGKKKEEHTCQWPQH